MAILTAVGFCCMPNQAAGAQPEEAPENEHKTAESIGKSVAAFMVFSGFVTLYALSICGIIHIGPFAHLSFGSNMAICGVLAGIDLLTVAGLAFMKSGCGRPRANHPMQEE